MHDDEPSMDSVDRYEMERQRKIEEAKAAIANQKKPLKRSDFDSDNEYRFLNEGGINRIEEENMFLYDRLVGNADA